MSQKPVQIVHGLLCFWDGGSDPDRLKEPIT